MRKIFLILFISTFSFSEEYLKVILFDKNKNYVNEYENVKDFSQIENNLKEGYYLCYPEGKPPFVLKFNKEIIEKFYEESNLKKVQFIPKECEYLEKALGFFKIFPEKEWKGFPFDKKYNFILSKDPEFLYLKNGKYLIEDLYGNFLNPNPFPLEFFSNVFLYPSFKTKFLIEDGKGVSFEGCKVSINYEIKPYGKLCEKLQLKDFIEGNNFDYIFPKEGFADLRIFCPSALGTQLSLKTKEINNPFIINLKRLAKIKGILTDTKGKPVENCNLYIFKEGKIISEKNTKTDKEGKFEFLNLEDGVYKIKDTEILNPEKGKNMTLRIRDEAQLFTEISGTKIFISDEPVGLYINEVFEVRDGVDVFLNIQIEETKIWEGEVISENGQPVSGAQLSLNYSLLSSTDGEGKFKIEFRGKILRNLHIWADGFAGIYFDEIDLTDPPSKIILKGKGDFKLAISRKGIEKAIHNISGLISFVSSYGELKGELSSSISSEEVIIKSKLPEGEYYFKIEGKPFKPFISSSFYIKPKEEYDYGKIDLELEETEESEKREITIKIKDYQGNPASGINVLLFCKSMMDPNFTFSSVLSSNSDGILIFKPVDEQFSYIFIYAEGEKGFLKLDMEELFDFGNLNNFDLTLNQPNELKIKIINVKNKKDKFKIILKNKYNTIIENFYGRDEIIFKNLFSPVDLEIRDGEEIFWKETLELKPGKNEIIF